MERADFEKIVARAVQDVPEKFQAKIKNVAFLVEDEPSAQIRRREGLEEDETLLGYYQGVPNTARGDYYGIGETLPDTIIIFQKPIEEEACGKLEKIKKIVEETVWHELAHYFGMDEGAVRRRENGTSISPDNY